MSNTDPPQRRNVTCPSCRATSSPYHDEAQFLIWVTFTTRRPFDFDGGISSKGRLILEPNPVLSEDDVRTAATVLIECRECEHTWKSKLPVIDREALS